MRSLIESPIFGITLSLLAFEAGSIIFRKMKSPFFNPLLVGTSIVIFVLLFFNIEIESYNRGANFISFFLGPATVVLAVPLYNQMKLLKSNSVSIMSGIFIGSVASVISVTVFARLLGLDEQLLLSLIPKSITTPIGIELSKQIGGLPSLTVISIVLAGNTGYIAAPYICRLFRIENPVAKGVAIGTSSHALGTTRAIEMGEVEGAMSGLAIGVAGIVTVLIVPMLLKFLL
ncbi:antiholin-like protein LrgB [Peptoclostridium acidaminophilum DSM 3953]|uniref:Antiholin-like protein LrgB n=1 Tax=Peptoclostridium acidaminophilum DSM 3953 TaxID=1286171 RepID=W8T326_PEPAC|nr:LrgB family protein [Peptoclostridium acidaminophilum]AHM56144.1 antiholin-like protein LrgB [Peptoclostridium acidaminophilum DSM 3953]